MGLEILAAVGGYFYLKNEGKKYQEFTPYVGNLISVEKKGKDGHTVLIKQGKKPIKLDLKYGGEDLEKLKKNTLVQITYNPVGKIGVVVTRNNFK